VANEESNAQLMQILARTKTAYQRAGEFNPQSVDGDKAFAPAAAVLSPAPFKAFNAEGQLYRVVGMINQFYAGQD
jgi:hypothetical protein